MGAPSNYSLQLPDRCQRLLNELWATAETIRDPQEPHLGPLTTTFLLAMATPIIVLPIERIEGYRAHQDWGYTNERGLSPDTAKEVDRVIGGKPIGEVAAPFFQPGAWRYAEMDFSGERLSEGLPHTVAKKLEDPSSVEAALRLTGQSWARILRNALAHGGVLYLNEDGFSHLGRAEMFAFVSAKFPTYDPIKHPVGTPLHGRPDMSLPPERLRVLRISQDDFRTFVNLWSEWLRNTALELTPDAARAG